MKGRVLLLPITLGTEDYNHVIPLDVQSQTTSLRFFIVENIKTARRYLRRLDRTFPIDDCQFFILNKRTDEAELHTFLAPALDGNDIGVMSEAGCPGVADPGATIASLAHSKGIQVQPLVGPSSILLTVMGSGFSGQEFSFHGYLPKERKDRVNALKRMESDTYKTGRTNLFMDTPFRNMNVLDDLLNELSDSTMICIASNLTMKDESIKTMSAKDWRENAYDLSKKPTMFAIGKTQ
jgi:16S rRNA (cytidine1402-2'-O)-methyltransferase